MVNAAEKPLQDRAVITRDKLLNATITVLMREGYAGAGLPGICREAGVSRGAQLHHFPTKAGLFSAAADHLMQRRLEQMGAELLSGDGLPTIAAFVDSLWRIYTGEAFYVWNELCTVARTDATLRESLVAVNERFYREVHTLLGAVMPNATPVGVRGAGRYITSLMNGLAINRVLDADDDDSQAALDLFRAGLAT